jgi:hypothetical protein
MEYAIIKRIDKIVENWKKRYKDLPTIMEGRKIVIPLELLRYEKENIENIKESYIQWKYKKKVYLNKFHVFKHNKDLFISLSYYIPYNEFVYKNVSISKKNQNIKIKSLPLFYNLEHDLTWKLDRSKYFNLSSKSSIKYKKVTSKDFYKFRNDLEVFSDIFLEKVINYLVNKYLENSYADNETGYYNEYTINNILLFRSFYKLLINNGVLNTLLSDPYVKGINHKFYIDARGRLFFNSKNPKPLEKNCIYAIPRIFYYIYKKEIDNISIDPDKTQLKLNENYKFIKKPRNTRFVDLSLPIAIPVEEEDPQQQQQILPIASIVEEEQQNIPQVEQPQKLNELILILNNDLAEMKKIDENSYKDYINMYELNIKLITDFFNRLIKINFFDKLDDTTVSITEKFYVFKKKNEECEYIFLSNWKQQNVQPRDDEHWIDLSNYNKGTIIKKGKYHVPLLFYKIYNNLTFYDDDINNCCFIKSENLRKWEFSDLKLEKVIQYLNTDLEKQKINGESNDLLLKYEKNIKQIKKFYNYLSNNISFTTCDMKKQEFSLNIDEFCFFSVKKNKYPNRYYISIISDKKKYEFKEHNNNKIYLQIPKIFFQIYDKNIRIKDIVLNDNFDGGIYFIKSQTNEKKVEQQNIPQVEQQQQGEQQQQNTPQNTPQKKKQQQQNTPQNTPQKKKQQSKEDFFGQLPFSPIDPSSPKDRLKGLSNISLSVNTDYNEELEWKKYYGRDNYNIKECALLRLTGIFKIEGKSNNVFYFLKKSNDIRDISIYCGLFLVLGKNTSGGYDIYYMVP